MAEDGDALEGTEIVDDWELVDFIVGKDGLQHYKINKQAEGTGKERRVIENYEIIMAVVCGDEMEARRKDLL